MGFASAIVALSDESLPASFDGLRSHLPLEWIHSCLAQTGIATLRRRKLPVEQVVWLVVGMGLFRDIPIAEVIKRLDLILPDDKGERQTVSKSAIPPARDRLGVEPLRGLFELTAKHWALDAAARYPWRGLKVLGIDGTTLHVPDSDQNRETFGSHTKSAYPMVRLSVLMALRGRIALDCSFAGCRTGEAALAHGLIESIPDASITILDRLYHNYAMWHAIRSEEKGRHWLVRARDLGRNCKVIKRLGPGDELAEIEINRVTLTKHPELPKTMTVRVIRYRRAGFKTRTLVTSLLDPVKFPAREIADLYHERWELELAYGEIKTRTLDRSETIRSKSPERVGQEILGLMIGYNLVRREMEAVAQKLKVAPNRISFMATLMLMRNLFYWAEVATPGRLPKMLAKFRLELASLLLPPRRERRYPRAVKMPYARYSVSRPTPA